MAKVRGLPVPRLCFSLSYLGPSLCCQHEPSSPRNSFLVNFWLACLIPVLFSAFNEPRFIKVLDLLGLPVLPSDLPRNITLVNQALSSELCMPQPGIGRQD